jgi:hypothetical protein
LVKEEVLGKFLGVFWFVGELDDVVTGWKRLGSVSDGFPMLLV